MVECFLITWESLDSVLSTQNFTIVEVVLLIYPALFLSVLTLTKESTALVVASWSRV